MSLNKHNEAVLFQEPNAVNKPNVLIKIGLDKHITARDKKVYNILIREFLTKDTDEYKSNEIRLSTSKIAKILEVTSHNHIYESLERLMRTIVSFKQPIQGRKSFLETKAVMISSYTRGAETLWDYQHNDKLFNNEEQLIIRFDTKLSSTMLEHADKYAKLDIVDLNKISISYGVTLYELFIRGLGTGNYQSIHYTEEELREFFCLKDKYLLIKSFTTQVIKKSIDEINKNTKLSVSFKRVKVDNVNVYKFEVSVYIAYNFKRFKQTIIEYYRDFTFSYRNNKYCITKDLDERNAKYLIVNATTFKTIQEDKAREIYEYMYDLINKSEAEFVYRFILYKDLSDCNFNMNDFTDTDYEELLLFQENYQSTKKST